jgi:uncharacterized membrane protein YphA (DoxX/SURF4 family)
VDDVEKFAAVAAAVVLGVVFLVSAIAKIASPTLWRTQAANLAVPMQRLVVPSLPAVEAVVGSLLLVQFQRRVVALVALTLLVAFTALLVARLRQGKRPPCACFGSISTKPIGWGHVARNAVFAALALVAAFTHP